MDIRKKTKKKKVFMSGDLTGLCLYIDGSCAGPRDLREYFLWFKF